MPHSPGLRSAANSGMSIFQQPPMDPVSRQAPSIYDKLLPLRYKASFLVTNLQGFQLLLPGGGFYVKGKALIKAGSPAEDQTVPTRKLPNGKIFPPPLSYVVQDYLQNAMGDAIGMRGAEALSSVH